MTQHVLYVVKHVPILYTCYIYPSSKCGTTHRQLQRVHISIYLINSIEVITRYDCIYISHQRRELDYLLDTIRIQLGKFVDVYSTFILP